MVDWLSSGFLDNTKIIFQFSFPQKQDLEVWVVVNQIIFCCWVGSKWCLKPLSGVQSKGWRNGGKSTSGVFLFSKKEQKCAQDQV